MTTINWVVIFQSFLICEVGLFFVGVTPDLHIAHATQTAPHGPRVIHQYLGDAEKTPRVWKVTTRCSFTYFFAGILINLHCHVGKGTSILKYYLRPYFFMLFPNHVFFLYQHVWCTTTLRWTWSFCETFCLLQSTLIFIGSDRWGNYHMGKTCFCLLLVSIGKHGQRMCLKIWQP